MGWPLIRSEIQAHGQRPKMSPRLLMTLTPILRGHERRVETYGQMDSGDVYSWAARPLGAMHITQHTKYLAERCGIA